MKENFTPAGSNALQDTENDNGAIAGFWKGMWHGFIAPFAFLVSLFRDDIGVYESHNNGKWYNFGYILGLVMIFGGNKGGNIRFSDEREDADNGNLVIDEGPGSEIS